jgi:hypothetical protein
VAVVRTRHLFAWRPSAGPYPGTVVT